MASELRAAAKENPTGDSLIIGSGLRTCVFRGLTGRTSCRDSPGHTRSAGTRRASVDASRSSTREVSLMRASAAMTSRKEHLWVWASLFCANWKALQFVQLSRLIPATRFREFQCLLHLLHAVGISLHHTQSKGMRRVTLNIHPLQILLQVSPMTYWTRKITDHNKNAQTHRSALGNSACVARRTAR